MGCPIAPQSPSFTSLGRSATGMCNPSSASSSPSVFRSTPSRGTELKISSSFITPPGVPSEELFEEEAFISISFLFICSGMYAFSAFGCGWAGGMSTFSGLMSTWGVSPFTLRFLYFFISISKCARSTCTHLRRCEASK